MTARQERELQKRIKVLLDWWHENGQSKGRLLIITDKGIQGSTGTPDLGQALNDMAQLTLVMFGREGFTEFITDLSDKQKTVLRDHTFRLAACFDDATG